MKLLQVRRLLLTVLIFIQVLWSLTLTISPATSAPDLGPIPLDTGFYGDTAGNIDLTVGGKLPGSTAELSVHSTSLLMNAEGYTIPDDQLRWKIYWASTDGSSYTGVDPTSSAGFNDWVAYRILTDDRVLVINPAVVTNVSITMGTLLNRVPAVQPNGRYTTQLVYTVTQ